jgi:pimeloyl-ACP methyl ester carboxylesterase
MSTPRLLVAALALLGLSLPGCALIRERRDAVAFQDAGGGAGFPAVPSEHGVERGDLDEDVFSVTRGKKGYWAPRRFFHELGANIYGLENYDPAKIPILFVHGAAGSPQDWRYFVAHIDRTRYQPWFFYYPSGAPVPDMSELLYRKLLEIQEKYHPRRLYITAHSLGGLVVRSMLGEHGDSLSWVKLFISISTPWGGERLATVGVRLSPVVVPSWNDLCPHGRFLKSLFMKPLPPGIDYYLLFSHRGGHGIVRPNNDGTVTLASQLRPEAQAEAKRIIGFDESHTGILSSQEVLAWYNALLRGIEERTASKSSDTLNR